MYHHLPDLTGLSADTYRRKSQEADERQILSLSSQEDICADLIARYKLKSILDFEEKKSAKIPDQREQFNKLMKHITSGKADVIVCWKINRLVRNMKEGGWLIDLLQNNQIKAIITESKVYYPNESTFAQILEIAAANQYSRDLSNGVQTGFAKKAKLGLPFMKAPIGYLNNKHKDQGERDWRDDPDRLPIMRQIMERILTKRYSPHQVFLWARNELKLTTVKSKKLGGNLISCATFYRALKRPEYANFYLYKGEKRIMKCPEMTPIITEDQYWDIQDIIGRYGAKRPKGQVKTYSGYIKSPQGDMCGPDTKYHLVCDCKHKFSYRTKEACPKCGVLIKKIQSPIYRSYTLYYNIKRKKQKLGFKTISEKKINAFLLNYFREELELPPTLAAWSLTYANEREDDTYKQMQERVAIRNSFLAEQANKRRRIKQALINGIFTQQEYQEELRKIEKAHAKIPSEECSNDWAQTMKSLIDLFQILSLVITQGTTEEKRDTLSKLGSLLIWNEEYLSINNQKWLNTYADELKTVKAEFRRFEPPKHVENIDDLKGIKELFPSLCRMWENVRTFWEEDHKNLPHTP